MAKSYYKTIHGVRYDRALLEAAEELIHGQGEGRISKKDAEKIVKLTKDGGRITETELDTLKYIQENYNFTPKAAEWFTEKLPAIEQAFHPDEFNQTELTQKSDPLDQTLSSLHEEDPSSATNSLPARVTAAEEFPAIEQALHPGKFNQAEPAQQSEPLDQYSSPFQEHDPSIVKTSRPDEATPAEKTSERIPHVIWGILLFASILISVVLYQWADEEIGTLESKLLTVSSTQELEQQVSVLQSERSALQTKVRELNQKVTEANNDQEQLQKRLRVEQDRLASALTAVPSRQIERNALQTQVRELNQRVAEANSDQVQLQERLLAEEGRLASASSEIYSLRSVVQALRDKTVTAEQTAKSTITGTDPSIAEVLRVLQENAFSHSDLFKVTSTKLDASLEGFRTNENILLDEHYELLNRLIPLLKPLKVNLKLIGHTYSKGGYNEVNLFLSHLPALVVSQYITEKLKFPRERIHITGRADLKSALGNTSREVPFNNRRVELHLEFTGDHTLEKIQ